MKKFNEFINEVSKYENEWANLELDKFLNKNREDLLSMLDTFKYDEKVMNKALIFKIKSFEEANRAINTAFGVRTATADADWDLATNENVWNEYNKEYDIYFLYRKGMFVDQIAGCLLYPKDKKTKPYFMFPFGGKKASVEEYLDYMTKWVLPIPKLNTDEETKE